MNVMSYYLSKSSCSRTGNGILGLIRYGRREPIVRGLQQMS